MVFSCWWFKCAILIVGAAVEPPKTPALLPTGALEGETNLGGEDEEMEEKMDNLKNDNTQALGKLGRHKHSIQSQAFWLYHLLTIFSLYS